MIPFTHTKQTRKNVAGTTFKAHHSHNSSRLFFDWVKNGKYNINLGIYIIRFECLLKVFLFVIVIFRYYQWNPFLKVNFLRNISVDIYAQHIKKRVAQDLTSIWFTFIMLHITYHHTCYIYLTGYHSWQLIIGNYTIYYNS